MDDVAHMNDSVLNNGSSPRSSRVLPLILVAIAVAGVVTAGIRYRALRAGEAADPYRAAELEAKYAALRPALANVRIAGWVGSRAVGASETDEVAYSIARYTLVPTLLCVHPNQPVVVADFDNDHDLDAFLKGGEFRVTHKLGGGLAILARISP